jgi:hypothetical protein
MIAGAIPTAGAFQFIDRSADQVYTAVHADFGTVDAKITYVISFAVRQATGKSVAGCIGNLGVGA